MATQWFWLVWHLVRKQQCLVQSVLKWEGGFHLFLMEICAVVILWFDGVLEPKKERQMSSLWCGWTDRVSANSWIRKDLCEPLSKGMLASTSDCCETTFATAVFNKYVWLFNGLAVNVVNEPVFAVAVVFVLPAVLLGVLDVVEVTPTELGSLDAVSAWPCELVTCCTRWCGGGGYSCGSDTLTCTVRSCDVQDN